MGWLDGLTFSVGDTGGGGASGGGGGQGPGFSMSRDEAENMLRKAKGVRDEIRAQFKPADRVTRMTSPADEPASNGYNALINNANREGLGHLHKEDEYLTELIHRLEKALGIISEADEQAGKDIGQPDEGYAG